MFVLEYDGKIGIKDEKIGVLKIKALKSSGLKTKKSEEINGQNCKI